eukprot:scaffold1697_cov120-Cylindrotheca_fusiformis.AAC.47
MKALTAKQRSFVADIGQHAPEHVGKEGANQNVVTPENFDHLFLWMTVLFYSCLSEAAVAIGDANNQGFENGRKFEFFFPGSNT